MNGDGKGFWGKYRGKVTDTNDPELRGRIRAEVPDVYAADSGWALPCAPAGGTKETGLFAVPPTGATVWNDAPPAFQPSLADQVMIVTKGGNTVTLSDKPGSEGGITLETSQGAKIAITADGIEINNGKGASIKLSGATVSVNDGALEVT
jgi:Type VI secretion system/phage-baseplate injector OB domain